MKHVLLALVGGAAIWKWAGAQGQRRQLVKAAKPVAKPKEVTTWEGEGGALRGSGSQLGPSPEMR